MICKNSYWLQNSKTSFSHLYNMRLYKTIYFAIELNGKNKRNPLLFRNIFSSPEEQPNIAVKIVEYTNLLKF